MADWDDVRRLALDLPETSERHSRGNLDWRVRDKGFVWERPLRAADLAALGPTAPDGLILGARVGDLQDKEAVLAEDPLVFFTVPHFDGYSAVLVHLERIGMTRLHQLVTEAWLARAPRTLVRVFLDPTGEGPR